MLNALKCLAITLIWMTISVLYPNFGLSAEKDIIILHTNDIHCSVNDNLGMAKVSWLKNNLKEVHSNVLLADAGDAVQGAPLGRLSDGMSMIKIMNAVGYDFCIPGNHEFDYGMERFLTLAKEQRAGYYSCNIYNKLTREYLLPPYKIVELEGKKIALIGVTTPSTLTRSTPAYFQDEKSNYIYSFLEDENGSRLYNRVQFCVKEAKSKGAEYVILVAHLGENGSNAKWTSKGLARETSGIDIIIDGHSHEQYNRLIKNKNEESVLLIQTGYKLASIGQINISTDGKISSKLVREISGTNVKVQEIISQEIKSFERLLAQTAGMSNVKLYSNDPNTGERLVRKQETNLGDFVADSFKAVLDCDVAVANGGGIRHGIEIGEITYNSLIEAFPFGNMCSVIEVKGQQLLDALEVGVRNYPEESGGFLQISGVTYAVRTDIPTGVQLDNHGDFTKVNGEYRVHNVMVGKEPLELDRTYTLGGADYILRQGGNGMSMFKGAKIIKDAVIQDYDAILEYLQNHLNGSIREEYANPYGDGRIIIE